jgi:hypothetical protein
LAKASHLEYNQQIAKSQEAQLLLNLVRLRYGDTPFFVEVTTITSNYTFNAKASATGTLARGQATSGLAEVDVGWTDNPSVIFIPFGGDKFARALLSPIPLETLLLLPRNGWSIERVMLCCVQSLNGVLNEPGAAGPTPSYQPVYKDFHRVAKLLRELQIARLLDFRVEKVKVTRLGFELGVDQYKVTGPAAKEEEESRVILRVLDQLEAGSRNPWDKEMLKGRAKRYDWVMAELREALKLPKPNPQKPCPSYEIQILLPQETEGRPQDSSDACKPIVEIRPRSLLGVFYYLSNAVEVPIGDSTKVISTKASNAAHPAVDPEDSAPLPPPVELKSEPVPPPCPEKWPRGVDFDWSQVTGALMRVCAWDAKPVETYLAVRHRNHWFYIQDGDQGSKSTFALLAQLFSLQSGEKTNLVPILTIH